MTSRGFPHFLSALSQAYRALLIVYPSAHRHAYGALMDQLFQDLCHDAYRQHGVPGLVWLCLQTLFDTGVSAVVEHLEKGCVAMGTVLETQGLVPALKDFVRHLTETTSCQIHLEADDLPPLSQAAGSTILGLIKEAAANAKAHAQAANLWITVRRQEDALGASMLEVNVQDDGRGFDLEQVAAKERARGRDPVSDMRSRVDAIQGDLSIESAAGKGTTVRITAPLAFNLA